MMKIFFILAIFFTPLSLFSMHPSSEFSMENFYTYMDALWNDESGEFKAEVKKWIESLSEEEYAKILHEISLAKNECLRTIKEPSKKYDDTSECPVCFDDWSTMESPKQPIMLKCGHQLCSSCEFKSTKLQGGDYSIEDNGGQKHYFTVRNTRNMKCPLCEAFSSSDLLNTHQLETLELFFKSFRQPVPVVSSKNVVIAVSVAAILGYVLWKWRSSPSGDQNALQKNQGKKARA